MNTDKTQQTGWATCAGKPNQIAEKPCAICGYMTHDRKQTASAQPENVRIADTFTVDPAFCLELVAAKPDQCRPAIENIRVQYSDKLKRNVAVSTNGRAMAVVPVEVPEDQHGESGKVDCQLSPQALKAVRKIKHGPQGYYSVNGKIELTDGSSLPVPDKNETGGYVDWQRCLIDEEREKAVFSIGLNPQLLLDLARAIGSKDGIKLTFYGNDGLSPMKLTPSTHSDKGGQFGILMPMRIS